MHRSLTLLPLAAILVTQAPAQVLLDHELLETWTVQELVANGIGNAAFPIEVYKIRYATQDPFGEPTIASGALVLPVSNDCFHALAAYMHGTILNREDVPSRLSGEIIVGRFMGATGYVGVLPDYLGLGDSPGMHPYIHAASEASASIDMLRAAREFCAEKEVQLNGQLFLVGYSQGGHACMATHKMIEEQHAEEFTVTASAPCSGPYDVSGVQAEVIVSPDPYPAPYYLPYILFAYHHVYPGMVDDLGEVLKEPWATLLPPLFQGNNGSGPVDAVMPNVPSQILKDEVLADFNSDPDHFFRVALRDNDLYDWTPQAPVRMIYCEADDHVVYQNSIVTLQAMQANGAASVQAMSAGASFDHGGCAFPALLSAKAWFDQLQGDCAWTGIEGAASSVWSVHPNPAHDQLFISASDARSGRHPFALHASDGRVVLQGFADFSMGAARIEWPSLTPGLHLLRFAEGSALRVVIE